MIENEDFWTYAPVKQASKQYCVNVKASQSFKILEDTAGNQVLWFKLEKIPPYARRVIVITAKILFSDDADTKLNSNPAIFLSPETGIESDHPAILEQSRKLSSDTQMNTVTRFYDWVSEHVRYGGYAKTFRGALYAFSKKKGDCTESAALFTALCRAAGIPARVVGGFIIDRDGVLKPSGYHNWSEFRLGERWEISDPQKKKFIPQNPEYVAMRIHCETVNAPFPVFNRFQVSSNALGVKMDF